MKISFFTTRDNLDKTRGYGAAGYGVVSSLQELGHETPFDDASAPVQIALCNPQSYSFGKSQYKIGYTPWESTELPYGWKQRFNSCDEVWATSPWVADVYKNAGVSKPIHVYRHGIFPEWSPHKRQRGEKIKFLHVGEPALRKGGQLVIDAFRAAFGDSQDVHLTMKAYHQHYLRGWGSDGFANANGLYDNVTIHSESISEDELVQMFKDHDVLVYPSYGEGFGFIPLQALATGMPTICTDAWAPYDNYLGPLRIDGRWDRSIWSIHPGNVYYPNYEKLIGTMLFAYLKIDELYDYYYGQAPAIHQEYNWKNLTEEAFGHIVEKFSN